jgi:outer membrane protein assembly factor BamB
MRRRVGLATAAVLLSLPRGSAAQDWPCWRGARGDGVAQSTDWTPEGTRLWSRDVGLGHSSPSVVGERLYTLGFDAEKELDTVFCLAAETGETLWSTSYHGLRLAFDYHDGGTLSTPAVAGERVYVTSSAGQLRALDATTGAVLWMKTVARDVRAKPDAFGFSASPVVVGDGVGGEAVLVCMDLVVCLDARTGEIRWTSEPLGAIHSTPTRFELRGEARLAVFGARELCVLDLADGRKLHSFPWFEGHVGKNVATPVAVAGRIFVSSGQDRGCALLEFDAEARAVWANRVMRNVMAGCVLVGGHLYGFDESVLKCLDLEGKELWRERGLGNGSLSAAGDRLVLTSSKGELIVADASPEGYRERWRQPLFDAGTFWSPPVFAGGRIFTRSSLGRLVCTDHRPRTAPAAEAAAATQTAPSPAPPDARSLFARHLELVGGAERVRRPRSIRRTGEYELRSMGVRSTTVEIQQLAPDLRREVIQFPRGDPSQVIRVFDGEVAYELNRVQGNRILDEDAQREARQTSGLYAAADWESAYASVQTVGLVEFADRPAYRVEARFAAGPATAPAASRSVYFDVATGFLLGRAGETEAIVIYDDWRAFDGLYLPMYEKRFLPGTGIEETLRLREVVFDDVVPEAFARPPEIQALLDKR